MGECGGQLYVSTWLGCNPPVNQSNIRVGIAVKAFFFLFFFFFLFVVNFVIH